LRENGLITRGEEGKGIVKTDSECRQREEEFASVSKTDSCLPSVRERRQKLFRHVLHMEADIIPKRALTHW